MVARRSQWSWRCRRDLSVKLLLERVHGRLGRIRVCEALGFDVVAYVKKKITRNYITNIRRSRL